MMMIIIILTASYIGDDVRIVYSLANTMRSFSVTEGPTNKGILGVGCQVKFWPKTSSFSKRKKYIFEPWLLKTCLPEPADCWGCLCRFVQSCAGFVGGSWSSSTWNVQLWIWSEEHNQNKRHLDFAMQIVLSGTHRSLAGLMAKLQYWQIQSWVFLSSLWAFNTW